MNPNPLTLDIKNLNFSYDQNNLIKNLNLQLNREERFGISGESGCGKSTLLKLIAGFYNPQQGEIYMNSQLIADSKFSLVPEKRKVGMIFQDLALFPHMSIYKNIEFGLLDLNKEQRKDRVEQILKLINLENLADRKPSQISGGQAQRVALGRALAPSPDLILLDEPFASLDRKTAREIIPQVVELIIQSKTTALLISHQSEDLDYFCTHYQSFNSLNE